jgi:transcriptional regulator with XRE-family HTH domain
MEPADFKKWRKSLGFSQKEAAERLGLKRRMIQYYEKGERDGEPVKVPLSVRLACYAIVEGIADYRGPQRKVIKAEPKEKKQKKSKD